MRGEMREFLEQTRLSAQERRKLEEGLHAAFAEKAGILANGDTSVGIERAEALMESLRFSVEMALRPLSRPAAAERLQAGDVRTLVYAGERAILEEVQRGLRLYAAAMRTRPDIPNRAYSDTLEEIGRFFRRYRYDLFAHEIPCAIDYQLSRPVVGREGILYINAYLSRLIVENQFCGRFPRTSVKRLLTLIYDDFAEQILSLYEPVAVAALGCRLTGEDVRRLAMPRGRRESLQEQLGGCPGREKRQRLLCAAAGLAEAGNLFPLERVYLYRTAAALADRLDALGKDADWSYVFPE